MSFSQRMVKSLFCVAVFVVVGITGRTAAAWHVYESGDAAFLDIDYQVQLREAWRNVNADNEKKSVTDFYFRRNRLSFLGMANETFGGVLQLEYFGGRRIGSLDVSKEDSKFYVNIQDAYATAVVSNALQLRAGITKQVLTREIQEGCFDPLSSDRSSFILFPFSHNEVRGYRSKTTRDTGVTVLGNFFSDVFQYRWAVMEGNKYSGSTAPPGAGYRYTARAHVSLLDPESGWGYRGSYLGRKKVLTLGGGYEMEPKAVFNPTRTGANDYKAYTVDAFYEQPTGVGTFTLSGAYLKLDFENAGVSNVPGTTDINGEKNGWYGKGAYMLGKTQIFGRYEKWRFANLNNVVGQMVTYASTGINYYIKGQDLRLTLEFSRTGFGKPNPTPDFNTVLAQVQARF